MLIQFYVLFPLLFLVARKFGPSTFLIICFAVGFFVRYLLLIPFAQNGLWVLGGCALCRLPEFALGMSLGMWHRQAPERLEKFLLNGAGLVLGIILYPAALQLYHNGFTYVFVDLATGLCCLLVIVGVAGIVARFAKLAAVFALVGAFSYGLYLVHQPYVIWLGLRIREQPIWMFLIICALTLAVLTMWGFVLEKSTNLLVNKLMPAKSKA
jgi:peptidoglycan/LPS O-acetylase OafA/YrhL